MSDRQIEGIVTGVVLGGLVGAALGILFAPQSGRKTREDICEKTGELLTEAKNEYKSALKKSGKAYESAVKQLKHLKSSAKGKAQRMEEKVEELAELGKEALQDTKSQLTKAASAATHALK
jgi:gas vesicle protein